MDYFCAMMNTILTRTSIRAYENRPVEDEKIEQLLLTSSLRHPKRQNSRTMA
jgi:hypothetical protein